MRALPTKPDTKTAHTAGPWTIRVATASIPTIHVLSPRGHFASVYGARNVQDARLIAAAPELLDACDFALSILEALGNGSGDAANACRAAIAKAEGRS